MSAAVTVIVPFKSLDEGKSRLASVLDAAARQALCARMLEATLALAANVGAVILVSDDDRAKTFLDGTGGATRFLRADPPRDLNQALEQARSSVAPGSSILVLPTDLLCLDHQTLGAFLSEPDDLRIAPDRGGAGTNLLYLPAAAAGTFRFSFGWGSFTKHLVEARRIGMQPHTFRSSATAFDLDTPADLQVAQRAGCLHLASTISA